MLYSVVKDPSVLFVFLVARAILRLSMLPGSSPSGLSSLLLNATARLEHVEKTIEIPETFPLLQSDSLPTAPHTARSTSDVVELELWGQSVEFLWRVTMTAPDKRWPSWDVLTPRLLLWRAMVGEEGSKVGEWTRREVIRLISK